MREQRAFRIPSFDILEARVVLDSSIGAVPAASVLAAPAIDTARQATALDVPPADTPVPPPDQWGLNQHAQNVQRAQWGGIEVLFLGDSITYGWGDTGRAAPGSQAWNAQIAPLHAANFGLLGDVTQNVLWQIQYGELNSKPKVAVLLIGTNNLGGLGQSPEDTASGISAILTQIRVLSPQTKILVMGIFPRGATPDDPLRGEVRDTNALIANLGDGHTVRFLDIGLRLMDFDGTIPRSIMTDYIHPSAEAYQIWADSIQATLADMLGQGLTKSAASAGSLHTTAAAGGNASQALFQVGEPGSGGVDVPVFIPPAPLSTSAIVTTDSHARKSDLLDAVSAELLN